VQLDEVVVELEGARGHGYLLEGLSARRLRTIAALRDRTSDFKSYVGYVCAVGRLRSSERLVSAAPDVSISQCRLRMFCRSTPQARQIPSVHLGEKPLAMQTTCGSDYRRVGSLMNLDSLLIAGKVKADQACSAHRPDQTCKAPEPPFNWNGKTKADSTALSGIRPITSICRYQRRPCLAGLEPCYSIWFAAS